MRARAKNRCRMRHGMATTALATGALLLAGCAVEPVAREDAPAAANASRAAREAEMNREWSNRTLADLLLAKGHPWRLYDIPGGGNPPGFVVVYPRDPATGCIDAFAVMYGPQTLVRTYQCR